MVKAKKRLTLLPAPLLTNVSPIINPTKRTRAAGILKTPNTPCQIKNVLVNENKEKNLNMKVIIQFTNI